MLLSLIRFLTAWRFSAFNLFTSAAFDAIDVSFICNDSMLYFIIGFPLDTLSCADFDAHFRERFFDAGPTHFICWNVRGRRNDEIAGKWFAISLVGFRFYDDAFLRAFISRYLLFAAINFKVSHFYNAYNRLGHWLYGVYHFAADGRSRWPHWVSLPLHFSCTCTALGNTWDWYTDSHYYGACWLRISATAALLIEFTSLAQPT